MCTWEYEQWWAAEAVSTWFIPWFANHSYHFAPQVSNSMEAGWFSYNRTGLFLPLFFFFVFVILVNTCFFLSSIRCRGLVFLGLVVRRRLRLRFRRSFGLVKMILMDVLIIMVLRSLRQWLLKLLPQFLPNIMLLLLTTW